MLAHLFCKIQDDALCLPLSFPPMCDCSVYRSHSGDKCHMRSQGDAIFLGGPRVQYLDHAPSLQSSLRIPVDEKLKKKYSRATILTIEQLHSPQRITISYHICPVFLSFARAHLWVCLCVCVSAPFSWKRSEKKLLLLQAVYDCVTMVLLDYRVFVRFFVAHLFLAR